MFYAGRRNCGHAVLQMKDGVIAGADALGGIFDGEYEHRDDGTIEIRVSLKLPPGSRIVTEADRRHMPVTEEIVMNVPRDCVDGIPIGAKTSTGPVNVLFKRLRGSL